MRKEVYLALIVLIVMATIFSLKPSLKNDVVNFSATSLLPGTGFKTAADIYKTTVIVYKGEVQLSDFDKRGVARPLRLIHEGQSAVVKAKRRVEPEEASRMVGLVRLVFPHIIETFYNRVEVWTNALPAGEGNYMFSQQDISAALNKYMGHTLLSDIDVALDPQGIQAKAVLRAGPIRIDLTGKGIVSVDQENRGKPILRLREMKAGKLNLPDVLLREMEKAFSSIFEKGLPVTLVSIQYQYQGLQVACIKAG